MDIMANVGPMTLTNLDDVVWNKRKRNKHFTFDMKKSNSSFYLSGWFNEGGPGICHKITYRQWKAVKFKKDYPKLYKFIKALRRVLRWR